MSDTCIVCLGDLGESASDPLAISAEPIIRPDLDSEGKLNDVSIKADGVDGNEGAGHIARLIPCGHVLHNNCVKPWVKVSNSCPICRCKFNLVELVDQLGGPVSSTYAVEDRAQVPDLDPSMIVDYEDDDATDSQPCPICGDADNEELLLLCDGCDAPSHTYCIGLDDVPSGPWYCGRCETRRAAAPAPEAAARPARDRGRPTRRTRAQQRTLHSRNQMNSLHLARVWQSVFNRLNLDLDFPFRDDGAAERIMVQQRRDEANRREIRAWQHRFQVGPARPSGSGNRLMGNSALLDVDAPRPSRPRAPREPTPEPESLEEISAWNAFERAREIENNPSAARKRKEASMSPSPEPAEPERKLKRPRTRRPQDLAARAVQNGESSRAASTHASARINAEGAAEPSFLQSLLKEVEDASVSNRPSARSSNAPTDHNTPSGSSPSISPAPSNRSSPVLSSSTPPPHLRGRPVSPVPLTSPANISSTMSSPLFSPNVSPAGSARDGPDHSPSRSAGRTRQRIPRLASRPITTARSCDSSPTRPGPSITVKGEIQKLVGAALKPYYHDKVVSKEEYTNINRAISRKFYEQVGEAELLEEGTRADLTKSAKAEVQRAIEKLKKENTGDAGISS